MTSVGLLTFDYVAVAKEPSVPGQEISFKRGDLVTVDFLASNNGWYLVSLYHGNRQDTAFVPVFVLHSPSRLPTFDCALPRLLAMDQS